MSDEISAASLLMAVVAILYGAWYQEIVDAANTAVPAKHDKHKPLAAVEKALFTRCLPLAFMAVMLVLVFSPTLVGIVGHAVSVLREQGLAAYGAYSSVRTAFCVVVLVGGGIAGHVCWMALGLAGLWRRLKA